MTKIPLSEKSNFAVALLAIIFATSIFKKELSENNLEIFIWSPTYLNLIMGFGLLMLISVYCYALQYFVKDLGATANKLSRYIRLFADFTYGLAIVAPIAIGFIIIVDKIAGFMLDNKDIESFNKIISALASGFATGFSIYVIVHVLRGIQEIKRYETELRNDKMAREYFHGLTKLPKYQENQYKILHLFKELEINIRTVLEEKGYQTQGVPFTKLLSYAFKEEIINKKAMDDIQEYRKLRNQIAHFDTHLSNKETEAKVRELESLINKLTISQNRKTP